MNYTDFTNSLQQLLVLTDTYGQAALTSFLPRIIDDAEGRIYRDDELDFQFTRISDITQVTTASLRSVPIPNTFKIIEGVNLIVPAGTKPSGSPAPDGQSGGTPPGTRIPLIRVDRTFLDLIWPIESQSAPPEPWNTFYAIYTQDNNGEVALQTTAGEPVAKVPVDPAEAGGSASAILIAPTPDEGYVVEYIGTARPEPLSGENQTTPLTILYPELFLAAAMVVALALNKNWGAQSDDPRAAVSWEAHYQACRQVAVAESKRQKSQGPGMTPSGPALYPPRPAMPMAAPQAAAG